MENNENLVLDEGTENVEQTTEKTPKTYTEAEFNAKLDEVLAKKIARKEAKIRKEYDREYGDLMETLRAGTGKKEVGEINDTFSKFYESKGIKIAKKPDYSEKDVDVLARADADEIIQGGFDEVVEEADRLNRMGVDRMNARDKAVFKRLTDHIQTTERNKELAEIGITEDIYNSKEFQDFARKFNSNTPMKDVYDIYAKMQPKKEIRTAGSMKNSVVNNGVKDYYTPEEIERMTEEDLDNPKVWEAVRRSMTGG